ncbi:MAG: ABC transporter substrate-binding protein [Janthinobacterium lividum]
MSSSIFMPPRLSRRRLLAGAVAGTASLMLPRFAHAALSDPALDRDTLVVGLERSFASLDASATVTSDSDRYGWQIFDSLYGFDANGNLTPRLATSYTASADGLSYTYRLRPHVKFHNGQVFSAADVRFSLQHILNPATKSTRRLQFEPIFDHIDTPDDLTVVFHLKSADGVFPNKIAGYLPILAQHYGSAVPEVEFFATTPVSAGPYKVKQFNRDGRYLELERFEDYWDVKPRIKKLVFKVIPEASSRTNALLTGEIDLAVGLPFQDIERLRKVGDIEVVTAPVGSPLIVRPYANIPGSPFAKREVRQALNYAIDSQAIIKNVLHGAGEPLASMTSRYYPYGVDPALKPYPYDPAKAKQLLVAAGYPDGFRAKMYAGNDHPKEIAEAVAAYWSQVGIHIDIQVLEYSAWAALSNAHQAKPLTVQQMANAIYDPAHPVIGTFSKNGFASDYYNPAVQALIDEVIPLQGAAARGEVFKKINQLTHDDGGVVFISELYQVYAKKRHVAWQPQRGSAILNFRQIAWS